MTQDRAQTQGPKHQKKFILLILGILFVAIVSFRKSACGSIALSTDDITAKPANLSDNLNDRDDHLASSSSLASASADVNVNAATESSTKLKHLNEERPYPRYLVIIKSSRVGSTFLYQTLKNHYKSSIFSQWEGEPKHARTVFEKCGKFSANQTGIDSNAKWACTAHLNDRFRSQQTFQELIDLIKDYNASVVIQMRANAIEKGISMSKRWGVMKNEMNLVARNNATEIAIANDVFKYAKHTLEFTRSIVHADYHNFIPLPLPTQERPLWIWYEDLTRSCEDKFAELFDEIGMGHFLLRLAARRFTFPKIKDLTVPS